MSGERLTEAELDGITTTLAVDCVLGEEDAVSLLGELDALRADLAASEARAERLAGVLKPIVRKFEELMDDWEGDRLVMPLDFLLRFNIGHVESWLPAMREALAAESDARGGTTT
jgi:hypothetical protein